jgi:hypothetical protein
MTAPGGAGGFLEFFILEAGDYVEQLDGVLLGGNRSGTAPDSDALQRVARALRGTATMAKIPSFAELAGGVERVGRALQDGAIQWSPAIGGALTAAVDDLKILLRAARTWSDSDAQRAATRAAELSRLAPTRAPVGSSTAATTPSLGATPTAFFGTEASNIAAGLELLTTRAGDAETASNVLRRVRALRGVAGVKEIGPLAEALEATEDAARGLETGEEQLSNESRHLLEAAAAYLRTLANALRGNGDINAPSSSRDAFAGALETWAGHDNERERVVPIATLFYADGANGLVEASPNPPTSPSERFRLELVSLGEHLKQVVDAARHASDTSSTVRVRRDLKRALGALRAASESFGEPEVGEFIGGHLESANHVDFLGLAALEDLASVLTDPGMKGERLTARLREIAGGKNLSRAIGEGFGGATPHGSAAAAAQSGAPATAPVAAPQAGAPAPVAPAPAAPAGPRPAAPAAPRPAAPPAAAPRPGAPPTFAPRPAARPAVAPASAARPAAPKVPAAPPAIPEFQPPVSVAAADRGEPPPIKNQAALLDQTISSLESYSATPTLQPIPIVEENVVPIDTLLYRGEAALDRAMELREQWRRGSFDQATLEELFDLLELARAE